MAPREARLPDGEEMNQKSVFKLCQSPVSCPRMFKKLSKVAPRSSNAAESGNVRVFVLL